jgi:anti-anti-sigma regulatory factor
LDAITKAGYPITSYTEDLDHQTLFSQNGHHQITPTITLEQILSLYRSGNALVLTGKYSVPPTITAEKLTSLCKIPQLSLETTHIPSTLKRNIKQIKGNLKENAEEFLYDQLTSVGGSLDAHNASEISAPILISVGGSLDAHNASEFSAPALISVGGSLDVTNASEFSAPALTSVDGDLDV